MMRHYSDVIMGMMASQITSLTIVYSSVCWDAYQRKHQSSASLAFVCGEFTSDRWIPLTRKSSASLAFVRGIHRWPVNSPNKGPVMRKMFSFDDVTWHSGSEVGSMEPTNKKPGIQWSDPWSWGLDRLWNISLMISLNITKTFFYNMKAY